MYYTYTYVHMINIYELLRPFIYSFTKQDVENGFFEKGWAEEGIKRCIRGFYPPLP